MLVHAPYSSGFFPALKLHNLVQKVLRKAVGSYNRTHEFLLTTQLLLKPQLDYYSSIGLQSY